jgi:hypothetical protein
MTASGSVMSTLPRRTDIPKQERQVRKVPTAATRADENNERARSPTGEQNSRLKNPQAKLAGRPVHWPQEALRRAHRAMLDSQSCDLLVLAR